MIVSCIKAREYLHSGFIVLPLLSTGGTVSMCFDSSGQERSDVEYIVIPLLNLFMILAHDSISID